MPASEHFAPVSHCLEFPQSEPPTLLILKNRFSVSGRRERTSSQEIETLPISPSSSPPVRLPPRGSHSVISHATVPSCFPPQASGTLVHPTWTLCPSPPPHLTLQIWPQTSLALCFLPNPPHHQFNCLFPSPSSQGPVPFFLSSQNYIFLIYLRHLIYFPSVGCKLCRGLWLTSVSRMTRTIPGTGVWLVFVQYVNWVTSSDSFSKITRL